MIVFKRLYTFLGYLLTISIVALMLSIIAWSFALPNAESYSTVYSFLAFFVNIGFVFLFAVNMYYLVNGIVAITFTKVKDSRVTSTFDARRRIQRGIAGMAILFLIYCLVTGIASFYGINNNSLGNDPLFESPGQRD